MLVSRSLGVPEDVAVQVVGLEAKKILLVFCRALEKVALSDRVQEVDSSDLSWD